MLGERALESEVRARGRGRLHRAHPVECPPTCSRGVGVAPLRLGDARGGPVEMPRADRPADPLDGHPQRAQLFGRGGELPTLDQRLDPPQLAPHGGAGAVPVACECEHLGRQLQPLGPTGRPRTRLLPGMQRLDQRAVVSRPPGEVKRRRAQRLDPCLLAVVERQVATLRQQPRPQCLVGCACRGRRAPPRTAVWRSR